MAPDNSFIADQFSLLSRLMDIHGENPFKSRAYGAAAFAIERLPESLRELDRNAIALIKGIGSGTAEKVKEILDTGSLQVLTDLVARTPPGIIEMLQIKGLGPKKIGTIWKEMGIETIGELLYACNENRLLLYKGFGAKTQENIRQAIAFFLQQQGRYLYAEVDALLPNILNYLKQMLGADRVAVTGSFRRQALTIEELELVVQHPNETIKPCFQTAQPPQLLEEKEELLSYQLKNGLKLKLYTGKEPLGLRLLQTTGPAAFLDWLGQHYPRVLSEGQEPDDEESLFRNAGLPFIAPCLRDLAETTPQLLHPEHLPRVIEENAIKGIIHCHSHWSDGVHSIEEMASACQLRGLEYIVISDHSKSAAYAGGLPEEKIREQHRQIDELNLRLAPFRIFKSIECDILGDGSLDYRDTVLATFDLVIASVHSNLKMPREKAMARLLQAIANPYTTVLGHMTGRLLLSREGYPLDVPRIIDACATHQVVIELNAHPRRLDIDWQWIPYALEKKVLLSINPDAHAIEGFDDCRYGIRAAQKGGLTAAQNLSSFPLKAFEEFLLHRKSVKGL